MRSHRTVFDTGIGIFLSKRLSSKSRERVKINREEERINGEEEEKASSKHQTDYEMQLKIAI